MNSAIKKLRAALSDSRKFRYVRQSRSSATDSLRRGGSCERGTNAAGAKRQGTERRRAPVGADDWQCFADAGADDRVGCMADAIGFSPSDRWRSTPFHRCFALANLVWRCFAGNIFSDGITDQLITDLAKVGSLRVISRDFRNALQRHEERAAGNCKELKRGRDCGRVGGESPGKRYELPRNCWTDLATGIFGQNPTSAISAMC